MFWSEGGHNSSCRYFALSMRLFASSVASRSDGTLTTGAALLRLWRVGISQGSMTMRLGSTVGREDALRETRWMLERLLLAHVCCHQCRVVTKRLGANFPPQTTVYQRPSSGGSRLTCGRSHVLWVGLPDVRASPAICSAQHNTDNMSTVKSPTLQPGCSALGAGVWGTLFHCIGL